MTPDSSTPPRPRPAPTIVPPIRKRRKRRMTTRQKIEGLIITFVLALVVGFFAARKYYYERLLHKNGKVTIAHVDQLGTMTKAESFGYVFYLNNTPYHGNSYNEKHTPVVVGDSLQVLYEPANPNHNEPASDILIMMPPVN